MRSRRIISRVLVGAFFLVIVLILPCLIVYSHLKSKPADPPPRFVGTVQKTYEIASRQQLENINCDLDYEFTIHTGERSASWINFNKRNVDIWRWYELVEVENGSLIMNFSSSETDKHGFFRKTLNTNYQGLLDTEFQHQECYIKESKYNAEELDTYITYVVDGYDIVVKNMIREWAIRLYVVFENEDNSISLHEYIFRRGVTCYPDGNGVYKFSSYEELYFLSRLVH